MLGAWLGWKYLLLAGFLACKAHLWVELRSHQDTSAATDPFGPFALGAVITLFGGEAILSAYLRLVFPAT